MKFFLLVLLLASAIFAKEVKVEYKLSFFSMKMDYKEYDNSGNIFDSENSNYRDITGVEAGYNYLIDHSSNIEFNLFSLYGQSQYKGSYLNSQSSYGSVVDMTINSIEDISFKYYVKKNFNSNINIIGGIGFGYRYWERELSSMQIEFYEWYSLRLCGGMEFKYKKFTLSSLFEYQYGIKPTMRATGINEDFDLSSANIIKFSLPIRYRLNRYFDLISAYVFEYQKIKESNIVYDGSGVGYIEPDSKAYNQYFKVGVVFKY